MAQCVSFPTQTQFATSVSDVTSVSTSVITSLSTGQPSTVTHVTSSCSSFASASSGGIAPIGCVQVPVTSFEVIPGSISTSLSTTTTTITTHTTIINPTATLFGSRCSTPNNQPTPPPDPVPSPPVVPVPSPSSTLPVVVTSTTWTNTDTQTSSSASSSSGITAPTSSSSSKLGPIIGGAVGGVIALIGLAIGIVWLWKKRHHSDIFDDDDDIDRVTEERLRYQTKADAPGGYQYGVVGSHSATPYTAASSYSGSSPPLMSTALPPSTLVTQYRPESAQPLSWQAQQGAGILPMGQRPLSTASTMAANPQMLQASPSVSSRYSITASSTAPGMIYSGSGAHVEASTPAWTPGHRPSNTGHSYTSSTGSGTHLLSGAPGSPPQGMNQTFDTSPPQNQPFDTAPPQGMNQTFDTQQPDVPSTAPPAYTFTQ